MREFTFLSIGAVYQEFLNQGYEIISFLEYLKNPNREKVLILRHDVDRFPKQSLKMAQLESDMGITATYYFRIRKSTYKPDIINEIKSLGHEIGYHYENLTDCNGNYEKSLADFEYNLNSLREYYPIETICMHGSPRSKFDNKELWKKFDFRSLDLIGEPYYDIDFDKVFYLTDTGRRWDGWKTSVRDKVPQQNQWIQQNLVFCSTNDIINSSSKDELPDKIMFTFHPQRWHDNYFYWSRELIFQNFKNLVKSYLFVK